MLKSLQLHALGPVKDLSATFGDRLNVLTGDNGLGKSFLLDIAFWALTGSWPGDCPALPEANGKKVKPSITYHAVGKTGAPESSQTAPFDYKRQVWTRPFTRPNKWGLVVYARVDGGFAVWGPLRNRWPDQAAEWQGEAERPRAYLFTPEELTNGQKNSAKGLSNGIVADWVSWYYKNLSKSDGLPFELLEGVLGRLSHPEEKMRSGKPRRVYVDQPVEYPTVEMPYGSVAYPHLSAGVRRIVSLAYLLVWAWYEHKEAAQLRNEEPTDQLILLVDEVESHLHPEWQRAILPALLGVAEGLRANLRVQIFAATHSPLVLASLEPFFDEGRDTLFWFDLRADNTVHFRPYPWAKQGDVDGWLVSDVFGLEQARSQEAEVVIGAAEAFMAGKTNKLPSNLRDHNAIEAEMRRVLPGDDTLWARWTAKTSGARRS